MSYFDSYRTYFEMLNRSARTVTPREDERIKATLDLMPAGIGSLLDVGCGDGRILNRIAGTHNEVAGLDISRTALKHVRADCVCGSVDSLPFCDRSFDILVCCEVLEHLPYSVYQETILELRRVARRYILLTVPYDEDLTSSKVTCQKCKCSYHRYGHLRAFKPDDLPALIPGFSITKLNALTFTIKYSALVNRCYEALFRHPVSIGVPALPGCPQCGYTNQYEPKHQARGASSPRAKDTLIRTLVHPFIPTKLDGWIITLYERT